MCEWAVCLGTAGGEDLLSWPSYLRCFVGQSHLRSVNLQQIAPQVRSNLAIISCFDLDPPIFEALRSSGPATLTSGWLLQIRAPLCHFLCRSLSAPAGPWLAAGLDLGNVDAHRAS
jgi:hypothetical protein